MSACRRCTWPGRRPRRRSLSPLRSWCRSPPAPSPCGRSTAGRPARGCSSARSGWAWRFPACITRRWPACGSTRCASTSRASSAPIRRCRATRWRCSRRSSRSASPAPSCSRWCLTRASPGAGRPGGRPRRWRLTPPSVCSHRLSASRRPPNRSPPRRRSDAPPRSGSRRTGARAISPSSDIYAIRANAHYTYIHDGEQEYFCNALDQRARSAPRSAGVLAGPSQLYRPVDRIARVKRSGEAGVAELGLPVRCSIPIARAHYREVKLRIGALAG